MPPGSTVDQLNAVYTQLEVFLRQFPQEIKQYVSRVQSGEHGSLAIYFNTGHDGAFPHILKNRLISYSTNMGGIDWNIYGVGRGFSNASGSSPPNFQVTMFGYNDDELARQATILADLLLKHPRVQEVNTNANLNWYRKDKYAYEMVLDQRQMVQEGLTTELVLNEFKKYNLSTYPDIYVRGRQALRFEGQRPEQYDLWHWQNTKHQSDSLSFRAEPMSSLTKTRIPNAIHKEDQQYVRQVEFQYNGSYRFGSRYLDSTLVQLAPMLPLGYLAERKDFSRDLDEQKRYGLLLLIMVLIFFICSIHFESFRQAFYIILLIPISFIGIFLVFYWFDGSFDQGGYTSFILLSGLVVNGLILLLNDFNYFRKQDPAQKKIVSYLKAVEHKFLPIFLTIISTVLGMIPFLMHGKQEVFWYALALGTMGGLLFSVVVILFVIPVVVLRRVDL